MERTCDGQGERQGRGVTEAVSVEWRLVTMTPLLLLLMVTLLTRDTESAVVNSTSPQDSWGTHATALDEPMTTTIATTVSEGDGLLNINVNIP